MAKSYTPPDSVASAARRALEIRAQKPQSQRGMTAVGIARAKQLSNRQPVSLEVIKRMVSFFERHAVDKQGKTWSDKGPGWQAWNGWGGDAGRSWANNILEGEMSMRNKADGVRYFITEAGGEIPSVHRLRITPTAIYDESWFRSDGKWRKGTVAMDNIIYGGSEYNHEATIDEVMQKFPNIDLNASAYTA